MHDPPHPHQENGRVKLCWVIIIIILLGEVAYKIYKTFISSRSRVPGGVTPVRPTAKHQPRGRLGLSHGETGKKQVVKSFGNNRICNRQASWDFLREKQVRKPVCQITWD